MVEAAKQPRSDARDANPGTALVARLARPPIAAHIPPDQWQILTDVIWPGATDPLVIVTAWNYCKARKLDPLKRPVHIVPVWSKQAKRQVETIWPGIGEIETTAARSGWAGMDEPKWGPIINKTFADYEEDRQGNRRRREVKLSYPEYCSVTVYRMVGGEKRAFTEPVWWLEAYGRAGFRSELPNEMWSKRPRGQLHKVAKAASLRAAFPEETAGDYTADEMEGQEVEFAGPTIQGEAEDPEKVIGEAVAAAQALVQPPEDRPPVDDSTSQQNPKQPPDRQQRGRREAEITEGAKQWLKQLAEKIAEAQTDEALDKIEARSDVARALEEAPLRVRNDIRDLLKMARAVVAAAADAAEAAVDEPSDKPDEMEPGETGEPPDDDPVAELIAEIDTMDFIALRDLEGNATWRVRVKDATHDVPPERQRIEEAITARRAFLRAASG